ncbi:unnamed protein product [Rotaria magnacalcarata]|uniref:Uncharacterized protein n=1 Tax=Rotaria magnacalcarata TaxID=392030 RepID=A0A819KM24_9BILA|nr:unnamed protein product [Rotaria magnacalcarata]
MIVASQRENDMHRSSMSKLLPDISSSSPFHLFRNKISNENIQFQYAPETSSFETLPQTRVHHEIKHKPESLWRTKLTMKTLLSMANRDEAQALKDKKPIDYHMFLSNKFNKNSLLQYDDHIDKKFIAHTKPTIEQQYNEQENRKLYTRLLNTMGLRKPVAIKQSEQIPIKIKRRTKTKPAANVPKNIVLSSHDSTPCLTHDEFEKPVLINYQAVPISVLNKSSTMSTHTNTNVSRSKEIDEKISSLAESFHSTTDSMNRLQQTCANLLLDSTKHYQLDVLNRLDTIEKQVEDFKKN